MADFADTASRLSDMDLNIALMRHKTTAAAEAASKPAFNRNSIRVCVDCDNLIDIARVRAVPCAVRCIECQRVYEVGS